ncbi:ATP synthase subunit I [Rhizobium sp. R86522]|uniref:N-ATPase subunit AtpR n=1 Tax=Rhizobium sp. R86522 TaxID=3093861 RepID=UPI00366F18F4
MDERTMIKLAIFPLPLLLALCFLGGLVLGYVYFRALRETANLIVSQGHPLLAMILTLGRLALLCAGFYLAVLAGGFALLAALAGVIGAKGLMLRHSRRASA